MASRVGSAGSRLRHERERRGWSQQELADQLHRRMSADGERHVGVDANMVSRWERGVRTPGPRYRKYLCLLFSTTADLLGLIDCGHDTEAAQLQGPRLTGQTWQLETQGAWLHNRGYGPVDTALLEDLETLTNAYRRLDYRTGASHVFEDTVRHLHRVASLADGTHPEPLRRRLVLALGDVAQLAGWLAIDTQQYTVAWSYCRTALDAAREAEDASLHAYVLGQMSYVYLHAGQGREALGLLEAAQQASRQGAVPVVRSWIAEATGEAHALVGETTAGTQALHDAETLFDRVRPEHTPPWLGFFNDASHAARLKGRCLMRLRQPGAAEASLRDALELLPSTFVRERSGTLVDLATVHVHQGEIEQACHVARQALTSARRTGSHRNIHRPRTLRGRLHAWTHLQEVHDLDREFLAT